MGDAVSTSHTFPFIVHRRERNNGCRSKEQDRYSDLWIRKAYLSIESDFKRACHVWSGVVGSTVLNHQVVRRRLSVKKRFIFILNGLEKHRASKDTAAKLLSMSFLIVLVMLFAFEGLHFCHPRSHCSCNFMYQLPLFLVCIEKIREPGNKAT